MLEAFALESYRTGLITFDDVGQVVGVQRLNAIDRFLGDHGVMLDITIEELEHETESLRAYLKLAD